MRARLALAAVCLITAGAACAAPATNLAPIRYDDCGAFGRQPHVVNGGLWTFAETEVTAPLSARTVAFASPALLLHYDGLVPTARYALRVVYATERNNPRTQTLFANDQQVHGTLDLPRGEARTFDYDLAAGVAARGAIDLSFRLVSGHNAEVSEVWLLSDVPQPQLNLSVTADGRRTVATVTDELARPRPGVAVDVSGPDGLALSATTTAGGVAAFDLVEKLAPAATGDLTVTARADGLSATRTLPIDAVIFRRPVLTPMPEAVPGVAKPTLDLDGSWRFNAAPTGDWWQPDVTDTAWPRIDVPGEWVMQGFTVTPNTAAAYRRNFTLSDDWRGRTVKLRFDAVFSSCRAWVNGRLVGSHEGGFTPFDVDVTDALRPSGPNVLAVAVTSEGLADTLASASGYARHALGGLTRRVTLFAVPPSHLVRFHARTDLSVDNREATLVVVAQVSRPSDPARLRLSLTDPSGHAVALTGAEAAFRADGTLELKFPVSRPLLWDCEHPNLYRLVGEVVSAGAVTERVARLIGFRHIEVKGTRLLVNGTPVKLHGTCRHEIDPDRGRSLTPAMWARDVELLKGANINYVRTSHYPPVEEFLDLCDRAGIYVQEEGPFCWVSQSYADAPEALGLILRQSAEMIERDRSHPSAILWDLANESAWGENFRRLHDYVRAEDPSRPTLFSGAGDNGVCEIGSSHYPPLGFTAGLTAATRPLTCDEYCHLNCYNVDENRLDPGLRDYWGHAIKAMWDEMDRSPVVLGGAIWCWADDVFDIPKVGRVGYGEWGIVDAFRRPKPEYWHVRNAYALARPAQHVAVSAPKPGKARAPRLYRTADSLEIVGPYFTVTVALKTGMLAAAVKKNGATVPVIAGGPWVAASKIGTADDAFADATTVPAVGLVADEDGDVVVRWTKDAPFGHVAYTAHVSGDGAITVDYEVKYTAPEVGVREVGLLWSVAPAMQRLSWRREGQWTTYPENHIGRLVGTALAMGKRSASWSLDSDPRGCNDFRSSKYNVLEASLTDGAGAGVQVLSDGRQSVRATGAAFRVNDFFNGGGESFLQGQYGHDYRTLRPGDTLTGTTHLRLLPPR